MNFSQMTSFCQFMRETEKEIKPAWLHNSMNDDTADLLQMFQKLGTTDHDVLIKQFQTIVPGVEPNLCAFFLEASNWTLQVTTISNVAHTVERNLKFFRRSWGSRSSSANRTTQQTKTQCPVRFQR